MADEWQDLAACRPSVCDVDFFPHENAPMQIARALAICRACPVSADCLVDALKSNERHGVRGGLFLDAIRPRDLPLMRQCLCGCWFAAQSSSEKYCGRKCRDAAIRRQSNENEQRRRAAAAERALNRTPADRARNAERMRTRRAS